MADCNSFQETIKEKLEEAMEEIKRNTVSRKIIVEISYLDFEFDSLNEAVLFADLANKSLTEDTTNKKVTITVMYEEDEDEV